MKRKAALILYEIVYTKQRHLRGIQCTREYVIELKNFEPRIDTFSVY